METTPQPIPKKTNLEKLNEIDAALKEAKDDRDEIHKLHVQRLHVMEDIRAAIDRNMENFNDGAWEAEWTKPGLIKKASPDQSEDATTASLSSASPQQHAPQEQGCHRQVQV